MVDTRFVKLYLSLPDDIRIVIMEFNSQHRQMLSKTFDDIKLNAAFKRLNHLTKIYNNDSDSHYRHHTERQYGCFVDLLNNHVNDHLHLLNGLNKCKCCPRHEINRPQVVTHSESNTGEIILAPPFRTRYEESSMIDNECSCRCRHGMRWICRSYADIYF